MTELKNDPELGKRVHQYLQSKGVETPGIGKVVNRRTDLFKLNPGQKIDLIQEHYTEIMKILGLDLTDDSLKDTPLRVAKMFINETFSGLDIEAFPKCSDFNNQMKYDEMVIEKNIDIKSYCEHHFVQIDGSATVAYMPKDKVLGLSKLNRVCQYFSRRPQVQERLCEQIYHALSYVLETDNIAVVIDADHYCVKSRGVKDNGSRTITSRLGGSFKEYGDLRAEFMSFVSKN